MCTAPPATGPVSFERIRTTGKPVSCRIPFVQMFISRSISGRHATPTNNFSPPTKPNTNRSTLSAKISLRANAASALTNRWLHDSLLVFHWRESVLAAKCGLARFSEPHGDKSVELQIRLEKCSRRAGNSQHCFRGEISAAHCAFHRGRPARGGPVSREKQSAHGCFLFRPPAIHSRFRRESCGSFLYDRRFHQLRFAGGGQRVAHFAETRNIRA